MAGKDKTMGNIELKIDGEVIVLTSSQTAQLKRAVEKETSVPAPKMHGNMTFSCKPAGKNGSYPFVISSTHVLSATAGVSSGARGYDFGLIDLKSFIRELKKYAAQIWTTAEKELKNI